MNLQKKYYIEVEKVLDSIGLNNTSPATLIKIWDQFVIICIEGYPWDISEFDNELSIRDKVEYLLLSPQLQQFTFLNDFKDNVYLIDQKLKNIFHEKYSRNPNKKWWWQGILKYAGEDYQTDVKNIYGALIDDIE